MVKSVIQKYYLWIIFIFLGGLLAYHLHSINNHDFNSECDSFQSQFLNEEVQLIQFNKEKKQRFYSQKDQLIEESLNANDAFFFHLYHKDTLVYWNTNQLPIIKFADIHFPSEGIVHAQNGWYYTYLEKEDNYTFVSSMLIKHDYPYENADLNNDFSSRFNLQNFFDLVIDQEVGYPIFDNNKTYLFSLVHTEHHSVSKWQSYSTLILLLLIALVFIQIIYNYFKRLPNAWSWLFIPVTICLQFILLKVNFLDYFKHYEWFQPNLYGTSDILPNFFFFVFHVIMFNFQIRIFTRLLQTVKVQFLGGLLLGVYLIIPYLIWLMILYLNQTLVENASIHLNIEELFSLDLYSVIALLCLGLLGYTLYLIIKSCVSLSKSLKVNGSLLPVLVFLYGVLFFLIEINFGYVLFFAGLFPLLFFFLVVINQQFKNSNYRLLLGLSLLALYALTTSLNLSEFNRRKTKSERELYANQLATEKDAITEVEFSKISKGISDDKFLQKYITSSTSISPNNFEEGMERRHFNGFWEKYEVNFYFFNSSGESILNDPSGREDRFDALNDIIENHSSVSDIDSNIFFVNDYSNQYSYVVRKEIKAKDSLKAILYCTLKSKKIPEEIGFPRLLLSGESMGFDHLRNYSVAKYHGGRLITKYGKYNYPRTMNAMEAVNPLRFKNFEYQGYYHFLLYKADGDLIVLSGKKDSWLNILTVFSYLFCFYGLLLLPMILRLKSSDLNRTISLAARIQIVLISIVFVALLAFSWGSGIFVSNQYNEFSKEVITEKLASIQTELKAKLGKFDQLDVSEDGIYINYILQKFAKVFVTDVNLYDSKGYLLGTSRPKVYNIGLLSEQMNPVARAQMLGLDKSEFIHQERIGELSYASAYLPFYNNDTQMLGYINLQHFGQQEDFENQIERFFVAIINVFMLLLAISIVLAIFVSNWVTSPLRILQENFANIRFGKHNEKIQYQRNDEIGALVADYNRKLEELEFAAEQLALSERESAWRDMAKQVAHEIKNPLTPMKLSVQHLLRTYNPDDPQSEVKLNKVANSLIEQIDALTNIANEFSNFAKMPQPHFEHFNLKELLENIFEVFKQSESVKIDLNLEHECFINADKDQILRSFNNLIKNAIQATEENDNGHITITLKKDGNQALVTIKDNGIGISEEERQKIFTPYFTTKSTGTGIGLSMVKQIIVNHKGDIYFESTQNVGTTFFVALPLSE